jgi:hypothetical protein
MAFTLVGTSTGLTAISADGDQGSLTLPSGVTVVAGAMMRGAVMNRLALLVNAFSAPIWTDLTNTVYPAQLASPGLAPTLADGGSTGYTGTVRARVQFLIKDEFNNVIGASELSPISNSVALVNKLIAYTNIAVSPNPAVNARRIYRTATLGTSYFWDVDIDDNTTTTLSNASSDASLSTVAVSAADYVACPAGLDLVSVYKGRAWGRSKAKPDSMYGSAIDDVTSWPIEIPTYPVGAERSGITGFGARRDDLVIFKRASIQKLVGDSEENFRMIRVAEGQGCVAPDSVLVIRDSVYWLDNEGVWTLGADDTPKSLTDDTVRPWFTSADYFNRAVFSISFAQYDPRKHSYDLFLCSTGSTTIDRWVSLDLLTGKWFGPHKTGTFTPSGAAVCSDTSGNPQLVVGASNGFLYAAVPGNYSDGASTAIDFEVKGKFHSGDQPDLTHLWLQPTILTKVDSAGTLTMTPQIGNLNSTTGTAQSHDLTKERERMARIGAGRLCQLQFRQNTAGQGVELYAYELPYITLGRR